MSLKHQQRVAIVQMLVCAALWSSGGILIKLIDWNPFVIAGFRSLLAAVTVIIYMLLTKQKLIISKHVLLSALFMSLTFMCFVSANKLTTAANAIVLQFTAPIFIIVFSALLFRQRFKLSDIVLVILTFIGISIFFISGLKEGHIFGNILGVVSGVTMSGMYIALGKADATEKISSILFGQLLTAVIGIPFVFVSSGTVSAVSIVSIIALGVFQIGIPYTLLGLASKYCPPLACCLIGAIEPLLNPVWVLIFNGERPGVFAIIGGAIVIAAVTAQTILQDRRTAVQKAQPSALDA